MKVVNDFYFFWLYIFIRVYVRFIVQRSCFVGLFSCLKIFFLISYFFINNVRILFFSYVIDQEGVLDRKMYFGYGKVSYIIRKGQRMEGYQVLCIFAFFVYFLLIELVRFVLNFLEIYLILYNQRIRQREQKRCFRFYRFILCILVEVSIRFEKRI